MRLATSVWIAAYRHPLETAKAFATLDHLSGGRVILGVGAGHLDGEFVALGVPFAERGRLTDAASIARRHLVVDGTMRNPDSIRNLARRLTERGYAVEVRRGARA